MLWWRLLIGNTIFVGWASILSRWSPIFGDAHWLETLLIDGHFKISHRKSPIFGDAYWLETKNQRTDPRFHLLVANPWWHLLNGNPIWLLKLRVEVEVRRRNSFSDSSPFFGVAYWLETRMFSLSSSCWKAWSRQSLVTHIDWKRVHQQVLVVFGLLEVANLWWRLLIRNLETRGNSRFWFEIKVANPWWRLLIGNLRGEGGQHVISQSVANPWWRLLIGNYQCLELQAIILLAGRQSLVTPIDWKL